MPFPQSLGRVLSPLLPWAAAGAVWFVALGDSMSPRELVTLGGVFAAAFVVSAILILTNTRRFDARIGSIRGTVQQLARGEEGDAPDVSNKDALGKLAADLAELQDSLTKRNVDLEVRASVVEKVLAAVPEGLVAVDNMGKICFANRTLLQRFARLPSGVRATCTGASGPGNWLPQSRKTAAS